MKLYPLIGILLDTPCCSFSINHKKGAGVASGVSASNGCIHLFIEAFESQQKEHFLNLMISFKKWAIANLGVLKTYMTDYWLWSRNRNIEFSNNNNSILNSKLFLLIQHQHPIFINTTSESLKINRSSAKIVNKHFVWNFLDLTINQTDNFSFIYFYETKFEHKRLVSHTHASCTVKKIFQLRMPVRFYLD